VCRFVLERRWGEGDDKNKKILEPARSVGQEEPLALQRARREHSLFAHVFHFRRDFCAGGLMILFGLVAAVNGPNYHVGTLMHMGPGFMPTALGVILVILGVAIAGTASVGATDGDEVDSGKLLPEHPQWLAWLCILSGPLMFVIFGSIGGMAPATFMCVFVSALGDRLSTWKTSLVLATAITISGVLLFHYLLQIPMPVLEWRL
jgi:hypothetical protein